VTILNAEKHHLEVILVSSPVSFGPAGDPVFGPQAAAVARVQRSVAELGQEHTDDTVLLTMRALRPGDRVWLAEDDPLFFNESKRVKTVVQRRAIDGTVTGYRATV